MRLLIVEPVLAHYRLPLFERLAARDDISLAVVASPIFPGAPRSVAHAPSWADLAHDCVSLFGGRAQWQRGLELPREFGPGDVLVMDFNPRMLSNLLLLRSARKAGVGVVLWGHAWSPTSKHWRANLRFKLMDKADVLLVYTDTEADWLRQRRVWKPVILAANNALDQAPIRSARLDWSAQALDHFRVGEDLVGKKLLLFCGRLRTSPPTSLEVALASLAELVAVDPAFVLVVVGTGEAEPALRQRAQRLGLEAHVRWVGELYGEPALAPWFLAATCFVYSGSIGLSILHAFGYGLPVVTHGSRELHNPEIAALEEGENGFTFAIGNPAQLTAAILRIATDQQLRERLSQRAIFTVSEGYSMDNMAARFYNAIKVAAGRSLGTE